MKSPALALVLAAAASLVCTPHVLAATGDYDVCFDLKPGQPCKNPQGQDSRCSHRSVCIENLKECPAGSTLLQSCSKTSEVYCYPLFDGKPLLCLDDVDIETTVQRDACAGKSDGTPCKNAFTEGNGKAGLTATVYEQDGVCEESYCLSKLFSTCDKSSPGALCLYTGVLGGKRRSFTGKCTKEEPFRAWCKSDSNGIIMGDAKVLVAPAGSSTSTSTTSTTPSPSKTPAPSRSSVSSTGSTGVRCACSLERLVRLAHRAGSY